MSVDLLSKTLVLSRNSQCPTVIPRPDGALQLVDKPLEPIGVRRGTKPQITEIPLLVGTMAIVYTDGLPMAGARSSLTFSVPDAVAELVAARELGAQELAEALFQQAMTLEDDRPRDDISVVVLKVTEKTESDARRLKVSLPL